MEDFIKFELRFCDGFMASSPQVYISGLLLSPRQSSTSQDYRTKFAHFVEITGPAIVDHWPVGEPRVMRTTGDVWAVAYSPNGSRIAAGLEDGTMQVWDALKLIPLIENTQAFTGHEGCIFSVAFSPDGTRIVSGSGDRTVRMWDAQTGTQVGHALQGHDGCVRSVAFSPDGARIVSGSNDNTVRIWDARTGEAIGKPLQGHTGAVLSIAF